MTIDVGRTNVELDLGITRSSTGTPNSCRTFTTQLAMEDMSGEDNSTAGGNTLWLTFLAAWTEEAQAKGSKVARTYRKAHQSLAACPIEFQHPCQTTQLAGIGPTIANKLEQELQKWCQENGRTMPERREYPVGSSG